MSVTIIPDEVDVTTTGDCSACCPPTVDCSTRFAAMVARTHTLFWTFNGSCGAIAGVTVTLTYDLGTDRYVYIGPVGTCNNSIPSHDMTVSLFCEAGVLKTRFEGTGISREMFEGSTDRPLNVISEPPGAIFMEFEYLLGTPGVWCAAPASSCSDAQGTITE